MQRSLPFEPIMVKLYSAIGWRQLLPFWSAPCVNPGPTYSYLKAGCGYCPLRIQLGCYEYQGDLFHHDGDPNQSLACQPITAKDLYDVHRYLTRGSCPCSVMLRPTTLHRGRTTLPCLLSTINKAGLRAQSKAPGDRSTLDLGSVLMTCQRNWRARTCRT